MIHYDNETSQSLITLGKYRIAACPRLLDDGRYAAQVSIASGRGSASTDRVIAVYGATNWQAPNWMGLPVQWVRDIPPQSVPGLEIERPGLYYMASFHPRYIEIIAPPGEPQPAITQPTAPAGR